RQSQADVRGPLQRPLRRRARREALPHDPRQRGAPAPRDPRRRELARGAEEEGARPMTLAPGTRLGSYEITAPLGAGGMGEVWRAHDTKLGRDVAIKVLPETLANDAAALSRFEREARAVAALSHPHILAIHDLGKENGTAFAVMELLEGETLRARLSGGPL